MTRSLRQALPNVLAAMAGVSIAYAAIRIEEWERERPHPPAKAPLGTVRAADEPRALQQQRALETERGRHAVAPIRIPWRGWTDILWRTYEQISEDRLLLIAAGVVFYAMLAIVPAITALVSMYGLFTPAKTIGAQLNFLADIMPAGAYQLVSEQIMRIAGNSDGKLTFVFVVGLGIALWSANAGIKAIFDALNAVYDEDEKRGIIKFNLISLAFTLGALCVLLLALCAVVVLPLVLAFLGFAAQEQAGFLPLLRWPALFVLLMAGLAVLLPVAVCRLQCDLRLARRRHRVDDVDVDFHDGGAGRRRAQFRDRASDRAGFPVGPEKPLGARGAVMADTVGAAQS